jgi:hypothetical protein
VLTRVAGTGFVSTQITIGKNPTITTATPSAPPPTTP